MRRFYALIGRKFNLTMVIKTVNKSMLNSLSTTSSTIFFVIAVTIDFFLDLDGSSF